MTQERSESVTERKVQKSRKYSLHLPWKSPTKERKSSKSRSKGEAVWEFATPRHGSVQDEFVTPRHGTSLSAGSPGSTAWPASPPAANLGCILRDFALQQKVHSEKSVASLLAKIDDLWAKEVVHSCDMELFSRVRQAAADVESGRQPPEDAVRVVVAAAAETEADGMQSMRTRMAARDCVSSPGGLEGLQLEVRAQRAQASERVSEAISLLQEGKAAEVRKAMGQMARLASDAYEEANQEKTAKSEILEELHDKKSHHDWILRQLSDAMDLLEATPLFMHGVSPLDAQYFFTDAIRECASEDPQRQRATKCLEVLKQWGVAAARVLQDLAGSDSQPSSDKDAEPAVAGLPRQEGPPLPPMEWLTELQRPLRQRRSWSLPPWPPSKWRPRPEVFAPLCTEGSLEQHCLLLQRSPLADQTNDMCRSGWKEQGSLEQHSLLFQKSPLADQTNDLCRSGLKEQPPHVDSHCVVEPSPSGGPVTSDWV